MSPQVLQPAAIDKKYSAPAASHQTLTRKEQQPSSIDSIPPQYLFMFFTMMCGPIAHRLCAIKLPKVAISPVADEVVAADDHNNTNNKLLVAKDVLVFPSEHFPSDMRCAQVGSKLYFFGGRRGSDYSREVYVLHTSIVHNSEPSLDTLEIGSPMNTVKPEAYALVANNKIYVIVAPKGCYWPRTSEEVFRFEVFFPAHGQWAALPEPPELGLIIGHAVVREKVLLSIASGRIAYFDLKSYCWGFVGSSAFNGVAHFVDGSLYSCGEHTVAVFTSKGVTANGAPMFPANGAPMFQLKALHEDVIGEPDNLIHLGDQKNFCYFTSPLHLSDSDYEREYFTIKVVAFRLSNCSLPDGGGLVDFFPAEFSPFCEIAVPFRRDHDHPFLFFSEAVSVPSVKEVENINPKKHNGVSTTLIRGGGKRKKTKEVLLMIPATRKW